MADQPMIAKIDNDTNYWSALSLSTTGGNFGTITSGYFANQQESGDFASPLSIPPSGSDSPRMFLMTATAGYGIYTDPLEGEGETFTVYIQTREPGKKRKVVWQVKAKPGQELDLELPKDGTPYLR